MEKLYAVVDLETTGAKFDDGDRIIQIGITLIEKNTIVAEYVFDMNPGRGIPSLITKLTGITSEQVANAPYFEDIAPILFSLLENTIFVAHNVGFDYAFLVKSFHSLAQLHFEAEIVDTVQLTQILFPTLTSFRLQDIATSLQITHPQIHHAGADAHVTAELLLRIIDKLQAIPLLTLQTMQPFFKQLIGQTDLFLTNMLNAKNQSVDSIDGKWQIVEELVIRKELSVLDQFTNYTQKNQPNAMNLYQQLVTQQAIEQRTTQQTLIESIEQFLLSDDRFLLIEAPSGSGKTLGYLLPLLQQQRSFRQIWISVPTIALQQQLIETEWISLLKQLQWSVPIVSVKSQRHYLDLAKWKEYLTVIQTSQLISQREAIAVMGLLVWLTETQTGDLTECNPSIIYQEWLQSIANCIGDEYRQSFAPFDFYQRIKDHVSLADIVVTNHAFLWSQLKSDKACDFFVPIDKERYLLLDECHQLEQNLFESEKIEIQFKPLLAFENELHQDVATQMVQYGEVCTSLFQRVGEPLMRCLFLYQTMVEQMEYTPFVMYTASEWVQSQSIDLLTELYNEFILLRQQMQQIEKQDPLSQASPSFIQLKRATNKWIQQLERLFDIQPTDMIAFSMSQHGDQADVTITIQPFKYEWELPIQQVFKKMIGVSATLPLASQLWQNVMRKAQIQTINPESDWYSDVCIYFPDDVTVPNYENSQPFLHSLACSIAKIYQQKQGKILVLIHSQKALEILYDELKQHINDPKDTIIAQSIHGSPRKVAKRFEEIENGLLLGLYSFWEGFDRGQNQIETVIITKLPFPNIQALDQLLLRKYMASKRESYYYNYSLPQMLMHFKQGIGRLIRGRNQTGSIWVLDSRAMTKYAKYLSPTLPTNAKIILGSLAKCLDQ